MPGYIYYTILSVFGIALAIFVIFKSKERMKLLLFFFFAAVLADCGEVLVLVLLNSYKYKPGLFTDPFCEDVFGHILPNSTLWPATAVLVASYSFRYWWIFVITFVYVLLDVLFVRLGIYEHYWWRTWMTGIAIFAYCILMRFWYKRLEDIRFVIFRFITFSFVLLAFTFLPFVPLLLTGKQFYVTGIFDNIYKDSVVFAFFYHLLITPICTVIICNSTRWYLKLTSLPIFIIGDWIFYLVGILRFSNGWSIYYYLMVEAISIILYIVLEKNYRFKPTLKYSP